MPKDIIFKERPEKPKLSSSLVPPVDPADAPPFDLKKYATLLKGSRLKYGDEFYNGHFWQETTLVNQEASDMYPYRRPLKNIKQNA